MDTQIDFNPIEVRIIKLICRQLSSKEIADKLGLSFRTVEEYRMRIMKKTKSKNVVGIALFAVKHKYHLLKT
jgi:DNA-binding CsgD family transcriptional regulator